MSDIFIDSIEIPEYRIPNFDDLSGVMHYTSEGTPVPIEYWNDQPHFEIAGSKIIAWLRKHFMGKRIGVRLLGSKDHPGKTIDQLIDTIQELGHDRYDEGRIGDRYENIENKQIELFVLDIQVGKELDNDGEEQITHALESFYLYPIHQRGKPVRIDIAIIYDLDHLEAVAHQYRGREGEIKTDGYVFKNPDKKNEAVLAILKVL